MYPADAQSILLQHLPKITTSGQPLPIPYSVLGCGSFGCVFRTDKPHIVFKITSDDQEAKLVQLIASMDNPFAGFVRYDKIVALNENCFALWREEVFHMGTAYRKEAREVLRGIENSSKFIITVFKTDPRKEYAWASSTLMKYVNPYRLDVKGYTRNQKAAIYFRNYEIACHDLTSVESCRALGETLLECLHRGIVLPDIRTENIGIVNRDGKESYVIADPSVPAFHL